MGLTLKCQGREKNWREPIETLRKPRTKLFGFEQNAFMSGDHPKPQRTDTPKCSEYKLLKITAVSLGVRPVRRLINCLWYYPLEAKIDFIKSGGRGFFDRLLLFL